MSVTEYFRPASVNEAIELLARHGPDLLVMAGGTIAMPLVNEGISAPERVMSLRAAGLDGLRREPGRIRIGAACPLQGLLELDDVPLLQAAARHTGSWAIRNMGMSAATCSRRRRPGTSPWRCSRWTPCSWWPVPAADERYGSTASTPGS